MNQYYEKEQPLFFLVFPIVLFVPVREQDPMLLLNVLSICKHLVEKYHTSKAVEMHPMVPLFYECHAILLVKGRVQ